MPRGNRSNAREIETTSRGIRSNARDMATMSREIAADSRSIPLPRPAMLQFFVEL